MEKEIEGQVRDYRNRKKRYRRRMIIIFITLFLIIAAAGSFYLYRIYNKSYNNYKVMSTFAVKGEQTTGYLPYGDNIIRYNKDGVEAIDKTGKILWNGSYEMSDPIADTCGKYVMVADRGNKLIHIYNEKGEDKSITTLHNIIKAKVASQGVVAAMMEENDENYIKLYYSDGSVVSKGDEEDVLAETGSNVDTVGYPMDIALSQDGKKLVVVYMTVNTGKIVCTVGFYNFGEVGKNNIDNYVGGYKTKSGIVVPEVSFLNNNTVCAYKEDGVAIYSMVEKPKLIREISLNKKIDSIFHNDKYTGFILEGSNLETRKLQVYNLSGNKVLESDVDFKYDKTYLSGDDIIMHDDTSCLIMKMSGKVKFRHKFDQNIIEFYPINNIDQYFLAGEKNISQVILSE